jgi:phosphohistidine swiveling domain-containing protein
LKNTYGFEPQGVLTDRIQAGSVLFTSNLFQVSLETFNAVASAMNFGVVASEIFLPADLDDVLWAVTEAKILMGAEFDTDFSSNIRNYVGVLLAQAGIHNVPSVLSFANNTDLESKVPEILNDPEIERVFWEGQQHDKDFLEAANNVRLKHMFEQLRVLPLKTGSTEFVEQILESIA